MVNNSNQWQLWVHLPCNVSLFTCIKGKKKGPSSHARLGNTWPLVNKYLAMFGKIDGQGEMGTDSGQSFLFTGTLHRPSHENSQHQSEIDEPVGET